MKNYKNIQYIDLNSINYSLLLF